VKTDWTYNELSELEASHIHKIRDDLVAELSTTMMRLDQKKCEILFLQKEIKRMSLEEKITPEPEPEGSTRDGKQ